MATNSIRIFLASMLCLFCLAAFPAAAWDKDSLAQLQPLADRGNAEAQYFVGMLYHLGIGGAGKDPKHALTWFQKAAAGGDPLGAYKVGCYYAGQFPGTVEVDPAKALEQKLIAANAGYSLAQSDVAFTYLQREDFAEAKKWWGLAANQGFAPAANNLSVMHHEGKGAPKNLVQAYAWFKVAYTVSRRKMDEKALAHLERLSAEMTADEIKAADKLAARFRSKPSALSIAALVPKPRVEALLELRAIQKD